MGAFVFHIARGELKRDGETIRLTERERDLLRYFAQRPGKPVSRQELAKDADPAASAPSTCRSTGSAARSSTTLPTRSISRPCAARATFCTQSDGRSHRRHCEFRARAPLALPAHHRRGRRPMPKGLYARA